MLKTNLDCSQAAVWGPSLSSLRKLSDLGVRQLWPLRYLDHSQILFIIDTPPFFPLRAKLFMYWAALISWVFLFLRNLIWKQKPQVQALNETRISSAHSHNSFRVRWCTSFSFPSKNVNPRKGGDQIFSSLKYAWQLIAYWRKTFQFILKIQREACGGIIFVSRGFRGSCLGGKLIAEFTKQAWNVCLISPKQGRERPPSPVLEGASWLCPGWESELDFLCWGQSEEEWAVPRAGHVHWKVKWKLEQ